MSAYQEIIFQRQGISVEVHIRGDLTAAERDRLISSMARRCRGTMGSIDEARRRRACNRRSGEHPHIKAEAGEF